MRGTDLEAAVQFLVTDGVGDELSDPTGRVYSQAGRAEDEVDVARVEFSARCTQPKTRSLIQLCALKQQRTQNITGKASELSRWNKKQEPDVNHCAFVCPTHSEVAYIIVHLIQCSRRSNGDSTCFSCTRISTRLNRYGELSLLLSLIHI